ncbi:uncharacterized protein GGS22DRAFT_170973 [Annulohypoxylon maeteangense]|uniref:uncharacterized protein n=1 Tax=Annulohypoxylon maeteangense TaxID=1927788 RepID=UPI0020076FC5|nr:uncharacterized protein GGS22DRAFT_170973 [Annulohypoxylon maeteangense]KAI0881890.1 hypothetical protein GGS22DRAFT_170973 [Annulohypoxylon maeteangense]
MDSTFRAMYTGMKEMEKRNDDDLRHTRTVIQAQLEEFHHDISKLNDELNTLRHEVTYIYNDIQFLHDHISGIPHRAQSTLPLPNKLVDRNHVPQWIQQMIAKMRFDGDAIGSPETRFFYAYSHLGSEAQGKVLHVVEAAQLNQDWNLHNLFSALILCFQPDDVFAVTTAWAILERNQPDE